MQPHELRAVIDRYTAPHSPTPRRWEWDEIKKIWDDLKPSTAPEYRPIIESRIRLVESRMR
jgi:hypothetical protein